MIIQGAMLIGLLLLLAIVLLLRNQGALANEPAEWPIISYFVAGLGVMALVVSCILPPALDANARKTLTRPDVGDPDARLARGLMVKNLVLVMILEGGALFNLVAFMIEGQLLNIIALGVLLPAMAVHFPTLDRTARWVERQKQLNEQEPKFDL